MLTQQAGALLYELAKPPEPATATMTLRQRHTASAQAQAAQSTDDVVQRTLSQLQPIWAMGESARTRRPARTARGSAAPGPAPLTLRRWHPADKAEHKQERSCSLDSEPISSRVSLQGACARPRAVMARRGEPARRAGGRPRRGSIDCPGPGRRLTAAAPSPPAAGPSKLVVSALRGLAASGWQRLSTGLRDCIIGIQEGEGTAPLGMGRWSTPGGQSIAGFILQPSTLASTRHAPRCSSCSPSSEPAAADSHPAPPLPRLADQYEYNRPAAAIAKAQQKRLQDVHGIIVELDESLGSAVPLLASHLPSSSSSAEASDSAASTPTAAQSERQARAEAVQACRQWLKEAQGFVLHLQRQLASISSQHDSEDAEWIGFVALSAEALDRVAQEINAGGAQVGGPVPTAGGGGACAPTPGAALWAPAGREVAAAAAGVLVPAPGRQLPGRPALPASRLCATAAGLTQRPARSPTRPRRPAETAAAAAARAAGGRARWRAARSCPTVPTGRTRWPCEASQAPAAAPLRTAEAQGRRRKPEERRSIGAGRVSCQAWPCSPPLRLRRAGKPWCGARLSRRLQSRAEKKQQMRAALAKTEAQGSGLDCRRPLVRPGIVCWRGRVALCRCVSPQPVHCALPPAAGCPIACCCYSVVLPEGANSPPAPHMFCVRWRTNGFGLSLGRLRLWSVAALRLAAGDIKSRAAAPGPLAVRLP
jgi:hypothetical protein